jgi:formylglycine-generating enzyme required for sulfatase activity
MGQNGNAFEWMETEFDGGNDTPAASRVLRGGAWDNNATFLISSARYEFAPVNEFYSVGFRVASIPEPTSFVVLMSLGFGFLVRRKR